MTTKVKFYYVGWHKVLEKIGKGEFGDVMLGIYQVRSQLLLGGNIKGGSITVPLTSCDWFGISCMTTDIFCFYLQNRLIQTSQTGGQQEVIFPPLVFPAFGNVY